MFGCLLFLTIHDLSLAFPSQRHLSHQVNLSTKRGCSLQLLVFLKTKDWLTITPFWHSRLQVFSKGGCYHELNESTEKMAKLSVISLYYIYGTEINIFTNRKFVTIYIRITSHEKTKFCKNVKFGSFSLAFLYVSCFNASFSRYTL